MADVGRGRGHSLQFDGEGWGPKSDTGGPIFKTS